ncbi:MAG: hypothetical protein PF484_02515 [Bacteroidales bacterium]|jgi:outer membrane protein assembly factor BamA|nr:hypothetical protein [Bacteroidales bacterium]
MKNLFILIILAFISTIAFGNKNKKSCADSVEMIYINKIYLRGNKITKSKIIYRELTLKEGDSICSNAFSEAIKKSKENINNTSLFNFVNVRDVQIVSKGKRLADIHIDLNERWYIWPMPLFEIAERNPSAWWQSKDISKINYGLFFTWENFRGRREALKITAQGGYDEKLGFYYDIPFINRSQTLGIFLAAGLTRNHEVTYQTIDNKPVRYRDEEYARYHYYAYAALNIRKNIHISHNFQLGYNDHQYSDIVFQMNPDFDPDQNTKFKYFSLTYTFRNDHRDNKNYALNGYYIDLVLEKQGLGISSNANVNLLSLSGNLRKYWDLGNNWYFASGFAGRVASTGRNPYFLNTGLGYSQEFVRGYEYYVIDGENFALLKTDLKYALFQDQISNLQILPNKFSKVHWSVYLSFFVDAAYSTTELPQLSNTLQNESLIGYGAGINIVTYYDMVFRFEYSYNKMSERGLFISFMSAI